MLFFLEVKPEWTLFPEGVARGKHVTRVLPRGKKPFLPVNTIFFSFFENIGTMENIDLLCYFYPVMEYNITTRWNIQPVISWFQLKIVIFGDFGPFFGKNPIFFFKIIPKKIWNLRAFFLWAGNKVKFCELCEILWIEISLYFPLIKKKALTISKSMENFHLISLGSIKWMSGK